MLSLKRTPISLIRTKIVPATYAAHLYKNISHRAALVLRISSEGKRLWGIMLRILCVSLSCRKIITLTSERNFTNRIGKTVMIPFGQHSETAQEFRYESGNLLLRSIVLEILVRCFVSYWFVRGIKKVGYVHVECWCAINLVRPKWHLRGQFSHDRNVRNSTQRTIMLQKCEWGSSKWCTQIVCSMLHNTTKIDMIFLG